MFSTKSNLNDFNEINVSKIISKTPPCKKGFRNRSFDMCMYCRICQAGDGGQTADNSGESDLEGDLEET